MIIDNKAIEKMKSCGAAIGQNKQNADRFGVAYGVICAYIGQKSLYTLSGYIGGYDCYSITYNGLKMDHKAYAEKVIVSFSGIEPKLYADVVDNNGKVIFTAWLFSDNEKAFSTVAGVAYDFMRAFNLYMFVNFGDE